MRVFLEERELFLREHSAAAYRTSAYYAAKSLAGKKKALLPRTPPSSSRSFYTHLIEASTYTFPSSLL
jgi:hypothetical protein